MNILMMTNTYFPLVGGVASSVATLANELRKLQHRVIIVSPRYEEASIDEEDVIRIPAIQHFNGSDFSVMLPIPGFLEARLKNFKPDIIHSHHPFFVGTTAMRISSKYKAPLVYTQHTMFEQYTHYIPVGFPKIFGVPRIKEFVINLSRGYANMADYVIAPSESVADTLKERGINVPIEVIPTGVYVDKFRKGDGEAVRKCFNIPRNEFVVGHAGRLAPEKNLSFLSKAIALFLNNEPKSHFLVIGYGPAEEEMKEFFIEKNLQDRVHFCGKLENQELIDAYHAMDVFAFSSKSETQGIVLEEAMAAGVPVVALNACGVREIVDNGVNGYLVKVENAGLFAEALKMVQDLSAKDRQKLRRQAFRTAQGYSVSGSVLKIVSVYEKLLNRRTANYQRDESLWQKAAEQIKTEWELFSNLTDAVGNALQKSKK